MGQQRQLYQSTMVFSHYSTTGSLSGDIIVSEASPLLYFLVGQMVVAKVLSRLYADMLLYGQSIIYYEHCVSVSRELKDKRLEGEYLEILSSLYLTLNTER